MHNESERHKQIIALKETGIGKDTDRANNNNNNEPTKNEAEKKQWGNRLIRLDSMRCGLFWAGSRAIVNCGRGAQRLHSHFVHGQ